MKKISIISVITILITSCGIIVNLTDSKKNNGKIVDSQISKEANDFFWQQLHNGNYDSITQVIDKLNLALANNPNDLITTAHLGFVHVWALSERQRLNEPKANIIEHLYLSRRYFEEANKMNPHDPRLLGFLADMTIAEGNVLADKSKVVDGYFKGLKSFRMWPQFNKFSIGYIFSILDTNDANFHKAIEWQYQTISDCACEKVDRKSDYVSAINKIKNNKDPKIARACWNSWIAPHNWEGFCLNFGDMLTKKGDLTEAKKIYNLARLSDNFEDWPHKDFLEKRILDIEKNAIAFNQPIDELNIKSQQVVLFNSKNSCVSCHQMGAKDEIKFKKFDGRLGKEYYFANKNRF
jgi:hypothetical protein